MINRWRRENGKNTEYKQNRKAKKLGNGGIITAAEWRELKKKYNYTCLCCGKREPEIKLTHDHVKPLDLGGENTIENSQPLCGSCNSKKGAKWIDYRPVEQP
jgi:5-methylcytosine-specific restriction endonuclease McrA